MRPGIIAVLPICLLAGLSAAGCGPPRPGPVVGKAGFTNYCAPCHQLDGRGVEGGGPPLAGSSWVSGPEARLIRIVLHGVRGSIDVNGRTYDREMLGFGPVLTDDQIAALLTFTRRTFGGGAGAIDPRDVARVRTESRDRTEYWTVEELLRFR